MVVKKCSSIFVFMVIFYHRQSVAHVSINTSVGVNDSFIVGHGFQRWERVCVCVAIPLSLSVWLALRLGQMLAN